MGGVTRNATEISAVLQEFPSFLINFDSLDLDLSTTFRGEIPSLRPNDHKFRADSLTTANIPF